MTLVKLEVAPYVTITEFKIDESEVVWYKLNITVGDRSWHIHHRYSEFAALYSALKELKSIKLPPKKLRPTTEFLTKRKSELETFLLEVIEFYSLEYAQKFADFLHFSKYEPNGLVTQLNSLLSKEWIFFI